MIIKALLYIFLILVIYRVVKFGYRVFTTARKFQNTFNQQQGNGTSQSKRHKNGDTHITYVPDQEKKRSSSNGGSSEGEYIDYEELK